MAAIKTNYPTEYSIIQQNNKIQIKQVSLPIQLQTEIQETNCDFSFDEYYSKIAKKDIRVSKKVKKIKGARIILKEEAEEE